MQQSVLTKGKTALIEIRFLLLDAVDRLRRSGATLIGSKGYVGLIRDFLDLAIGFHLKEARQTSHRLFRVKSRPARRASESFRVNLSSHCCWFGVSFYRLDAGREPKRVRR
jgi:hypothetical protein